MQRYDRGERRHQTARLKAKRQFFYGYGQVDTSNERMAENRKGFAVTTAAPCSCWACGGHYFRYSNSWKGKTIQELSHLEVFRKGLI